jgi:hypothetical protein
MNHAKWSFLISTTRRGPLYQRRSKTFRTILVTRIGCNVKDFPEGHFRFKRTISTSISKFYFKRTIFKILFLNDTSNSKGHFKISLQKGQFPPFHLKKKDLTLLEKLTILSTFAFRCSDDSTPRCALLVANGTRLEVRNKCENTARSAHAVYFLLFSPLWKLTLL